ncbi:MAG: outer membrane protein [Parvibaculaceae bacterium]
MRKVLLATVSIAGLGLGFSTAQAADVVAPEPVCVWCGFHVGAGGGVGYNFYNADAEATLGIAEDSEDGNFLTILGQSLNGDDLGQWYGFGTIEVGFDYQFDQSPFVIGVLANYDFNGDTEAEANGSLFTPLGPGASLDNRVSAETDDAWFLGARLGFATGLMDSQDTLLYVLGGYTWIKGKVKTENSVSFGGNSVGLEAEDKSSVDGWTLGAGIEHLITENLSLKLEYRHDFLDDIDVDETTTFDVFGGSDPDLAINQTANVDFSRDTVRAVLSWRFNPW